MLRPQKKYESVDEYISGFPEEVGGKLKSIREAIKKAAPDAKEIISYNMPAFKTSHILVYYAAFKNHIGFFPTASGIAAFKKELTGYKLSKGTVQFPYDKPIPIPLVKKIVKYRLKENLKKKETK